MRVTVKLGDPLWRAAGTRKVEVHLPQSSAMAANVIEVLRERYPTLAHELNRPASPNAALPFYVFVGHRKVPWDALENVAVRDGETISIFSIVVGG